MISRRDALRLVPGAVLLVAGLGAAAPARALGGDEAESFVRETVDEVLALVRQPGSADSKADELRTILERRAAMPQIARAAAGPIWRDMSAAEQDRYTDAFILYISKIYARRFSEYSGEQVEVGRARDQGNRGVLVTTTVRGGGGQPVAVEWLVTDRPGRTVVADIVIEGVSLVITQRDEISGIYASRGRDAGKLIEFLQNA